MDSVRMVTQTNLPLLIEWGRWGVLTAGRKDTSIHGAVPFTVPSRD